MDRSIKLIMYSLLNSICSEVEEEYNQEEEEENCFEDEDGEKESDDEDWWIEGCVEGDWDPAGKYVSEDYTHHFRTDQRWDTKEDLYNWAREIAKGLMIVLVIRNSNQYRISMVCERFGRPSLLPAKKIQRSKNKKCFCRFELLGALSKKDHLLDRESQRENQKWIIGVLEGRHNHRRNNGRRTPSEIEVDPRVDSLSNLASTKQVTNFLQQLNYEDRGELTITQWSLKFLVEHDYLINPLKNRSNNQVEILFFANKESLHLLKKFPYVVVIDATFKTNKYDMTLIQIIGFTCTHLTFNVGFAFTRAEKTFHYTWIMKKLRAVYEDIGVMPTAIMTDREKTLINGINEVFGSEVQHLLCWVHIMNNLKAHAYPILKNADKVKSFAYQCWALFCSRSEQVYEEKLARIRNSWRSSLVGYLEREWLTPYKKNIVKAWTEHKLHFFTITPNRVEGLYNVLKEIIGSSRGGFNRITVRIHHAIVQQVDKIKASMNAALSKKPIDFENDEIHHRVELIPAPLFYNVSDRCFSLLLDTCDRLMRGDFTEECMDQWVRKCQGLPCDHEVAIALVERKPLTLEDVHDFWKELKWEDSSTTIEINLCAKEVTHRRIRDMWSKCTSGKLKQRTAYQLGELYNDFQNPGNASFIEPTES